MFSRLATLGMDGNLGAFAKVMWELPVVDKLPSLVLGLTNDCGLCAARGEDDLAGNSKSNVIWSGLTTGGALEAVAELDTVL